MNFDRTDRKIREMNQHFNSLGSSRNVDEFEGNFAAFISAARSVTLALRKDAGITFDEGGNIKKKGNISGFADWYIGKQGEMRQDELCRYFKGIRDRDLHTGDSVVQSGYTIKGGVRITAPEGGITMIGPRGTYEVYGHKTPTEKRIQKKLGAKEIFTIVLKNLPSKHLNKTIQPNNPLIACNLYKNYLGNLVIEAKHKFLDK